MLRTTDEQLCGDIAVGTGELEVAAHLPAQTPGETRGAIVCLDTNRIVLSCVRRIGRCATTIGLVVRTGSIAARALGVHPGTMIMQASRRRTAGPSETIRGRFLLASLAAAAALTPSLGCSDTSEPSPIVAGSSTPPTPTTPVPTTTTTGTTPPPAGDAAAPIADSGVSPKPDAGPDNGTGGTGGPTGFREITGVAGLKFQMDAPAPPASGKPLGLLVLLHGSTASNYGNFVNLMRDVAARYELIRVSVLAPNGQGWNEGGNAAQVAAADKLHEMVQQDLFPKYNIDKTKVLFSGQSSGGGFLSSHFVPLHAKDYRGGVFLQCGAAPPASAFAPDAATKAGFRMHFEITTGDGIWPQSYAQSTTAYMNAGMMLTKDGTKPGGHCAFDQQKVIQDHIVFVLGP